MNKRSDARPRRSDGSESGRDSLSGTVWGRGAGGGTTRLLRSRVEDVEVRVSPRGPDVTYFEPK